MTKSNLRKSRIKHSKYQFSRRSLRRSNCFQKRRSRSLGDIGILMLVIRSLILRSDHNQQSLHQRDNRELKSASPKNKVINEHGDSTTEKKMPRRKVADLNQRKRYSKFWLFHRQKKFHPVNLCFGLLLSSQPASHLVSRLPSSNHSFRQNPNPEGGC